MVTDTFSAGRFYETQVMLHKICLLILLYSVPKMLIKIFIQGIALALLQSFVFYAMIRRMSGIRTETASDDSASHPEKG